jgi:hypothetical protein
VISQRLRTTGLNKGSALSPLLFNFAVESVIRKVQENQMQLKLNGTHQLLVYADDVNLLGDDRYHTKKHRNSDTSNKGGLKVNAKKTKYM